MDGKIRVTVWNEFIHERENERVAEVYPEGIHNAIAGYLKNLERLDVRTATLNQPDHGLGDQTLNTTDVLIWWGHIAHDKVDDRIVDKIYKRVILDGMGLIVLHSAHFSKIFKRLMGTTCNLKWREIGEKERLWIVNRGHPITDGLGEYVEIEHAEMYGEPFDIPPPDELIFISWFKGGEVFRSGCCFYRGAGKIFYFRPGHETYPIYHDRSILKIIGNAVYWASPVRGVKARFGRTEPLEDL